MADPTGRIAGLSCRDVLGHLADYVDRELGAAVVEQVDAHLNECDRCRKFGGEYSAFVKSLRTQVPHPRTGDEESLRRLQRTMAQQWR